MGWKMLIRNTPLYNSHVYVAHNLCSIYKIDLCVIWMYLFIYYLIHDQISNLFIHNLKTREHWHHKLKCNRPQHRESKTKNPTVWRFWDRKPRLHRNNDKYLRYRLYTPFWSLSPLKILRLQFVNLKIRRFTYYRN